MKKFLFTLLILLFGNSVILPAQIIKTERFTKGEGLSEEVVLEPFQDSYGLIWICTTEGLDVYDGHSMKVYKNIPGDPNSLIENTLYKVDEDKAGNIWMATRGGVSKFVRAENRFINYINADTIKYKNAPHDQVFTLLVDDENNVWVPDTKEGSVKRFNQKADKWEIVPSKWPDSIPLGHRRLSVLANAIAKDMDGKIWIGSSWSFGLAYYDAQEKVFKQAEIKSKAKMPDITKPENIITYLYFDQNKVLWFTTRGGVYKYNPKNKELTIIEEYTVNNNQRYSFDNGIFQDVKKNVWVTNNFRGILKFQGVSDTFKRIQIEGWKHTENSTSNLIIGHSITDKSGIIWLSTHAGLLKYNENNVPFNLYNHNANDKNSLNNNQINCLAESKKFPGKIYVGTESGGINLFDAATKTFENIPYAYDKLVKNPAVRSILEDDDGSLWLGTRYNGLLKMNSKHEIIENYIPSKIPDDGGGNPHLDAINVIKKDSKGNIWFGSEILRVLDPKTKSIIKVSEPYFALYPTPLMTQIYQKIVNNEFISEIKEVGDNQNLTKKFSITKPGDYIIVSAGERNNTNKQTFEKQMWDYGWIEDENGKTIWTMNDNKNKYHIGGYWGNVMIADIVKLKAGQYALRYISNAGHSYHYWFIQPPTYKELWGIRIFPVKNEQEKQIITKALSETSQPILLKGGVIKEDKGSIIKAIEFWGNNIVWIGNDSGLNKFNIETHEAKNYAHQPGNSNSLSDNAIQHIYQDTGKGMLWIATPAGLNKFDPKTEKFTVYTEKDGLPSDYISGIVTGNKNELMISTSKGISRMSINEATGRATFINYGLAYGLGGISFTAAAALKTSDGKYYFGGNHGLNELAALYTNPTPPMMLFTDLKISNVSVLTMGEKSPLKTSLLEAKEIILSNTQNDLVFEFEALHYANPAKNKYAHKLEGYDKDWVYDDNKFAAYPNLNHGNYVFMIKAANSDGVWNEKGKSLIIKILPPWWQTWWFRFMLLGIFSSTLGLSVKIYTNRKLRQQQNIINRERALTQERNRIAGEMHDEIGAGLSTIRLISNRAKLRITDDVARNQIEKVADNASNLVERMAVIIWAMNSNNDNAEGLISFFQRYATEFIGIHELDFRFNIAPEVYNIERIITGERRRQVFLVFKETLNNIVKHAQGNLVQINFNVENNNLKITISDNGKGFDKNQKIVGLGGNGIVNMRSRMKQAQGSYEIKSEVGKGTTTTLALELKNGILTNKS